MSSTTTTTTTTTTTMTESPAATTFSTNLRGDDLVGREISINYEADEWFSAIIVRYYEKDDEYKIVYTAEDAIEILSLDSKKWILKPKERRTRNNPALSGAIIEFKYPIDQKWYKAMIYATSRSGKTVKIAYLDDFSTDRLRGGGWDVVTESPCVI